MRCTHPKCTGNHTYWKADTLCPRSREHKNAVERHRYDAMTWREHHANQLRVRRLKAVQRMETRMPEGDGQSSIRGWPSFKTGG